MWMLSTVFRASRGELVAKLFAEHDEPVHFEDVVHVDAAT